MRECKETPRPTYANGIKFDSRQTADRYLDLKVLEIAGNVKGYHCSDCNSVYNEFEIDNDDSNCPVCEYPLRQIKDIGKELTELQEGMLLL